MKVWMKKHVFNLLILFFTVNVESLNDEERTVVAGYMPEYRSYIDLDASSKHLTDIILFSIAPKTDGSLTETCCLGKEHFEKVRNAQDLSEELRIWVSIGGAGRSDGFSSIVSSQRTRKIFVQELVTLCFEENISGIDFDWEQPQSESDYHGYLLLLHDASVVLHSLGKLISVALHPRQYLPREFYDYIDRVHIMTYDMIIQKQNSLHEYYGHSDSGLMVRELKNFMDSGCPPSKIVVGIPMYGRHVKNPGLVKTYSELMDAAQKKSIGKQQLLSLDIIDGYSFDSPVDIRDKIHYVLSHGFRGIFFWEIGQDYYDTKVGGMLLEAATAAIRETMDHDEL